MKILFLAQYITIDKHPIFGKNRTGYGLMVKDLAQAIARSEDVDLHVMSYFTPEFVCDGVKILKRRKWDIICHFKVQYIFLLLRLIVKYRLNVKRILRLVYYYSSLGYLEYLIKQGKYDIVHMHGVGIVTEGYIKCCQKMHVPFLITLHGLNSFEKSIALPVSEKRYEKEFIRQIDKRNIYVSVISSGIKMLMSTISQCDNCRVISNGCNVQVRKGRSIRQQYHMSNEDFIFLCVGNISKNKNQIQVAKAFLQLPLDFQRKARVMFVGDYQKGCELEMFIKKEELENRLILIGSVNKDEMQNFYSSSNATVMASLSEGFGLSIIEGYANGLPSVFFKDFFAAMDISTPNASVLVKERTDEALAKGMQQVMSKKWNVELIKEYASNFSIDKIAQRYVVLYHEVIKWAR